jgi:Phage late-transcription coactivator
MLRAQNAELFAQHIETTVTTLGISYMDAILKFCSDRELEPEAVAPYISAKMKDSIAHEARRLHLLPQTTSLLD